MGLIVGADKDPHPDTWNERFKWVRDKTTDLNRAGYGPSNPYIPPLRNPDTLLGFLERHEELIRTGFTWNGGLFFFSQPFMIMWNGVGNGDAFDLYWYNNYQAEGLQTYPNGIHKYYDVYSWEGYK